MTRQFNSAEAVFQTLAARIDNLTMDVSMDDASGLPEVTLTDPTSEHEYLIHATPASLRSAPHNYIVVLSAYGEDWFVMYDDEGAPVRIPISEAGNAFIETASLPFDEAIHRVLDEANSSTPAPNTGTQVYDGTSTDNDESYAGTGGDTKVYDGTDNEGLYEATLHFDGASRDNPGQAATGYVLESGMVQLDSGGTYLGDDITNNVAEYRALFDSLSAALNYDIDDITIYGDSELIVKQVNGDWNCNDDTLSGLHEHVHSMLSQFNSWTLEHVDRSNNSAADRKANTVLDNAL